MSSKSVEDIANAVLYEGYTLHPDSALSVKNRQRWNFGVVYPRAYSEAQGGIDPWLTQTECLIKGDARARMTIRVRFLQTIDQSIGATSASPFAPTGVCEPCFRSVAELRVGNQIFDTRQEAAGREVSVDAVGLEQLVSAPLVQPFELHEREEYEGIPGTDGELAGLVRRTQERITGGVEAAASCVRNGVYKLTLRVSNSTPVANPKDCSRESALRRALLSAHSILRLEQGEFTSLLDPPDELRDVTSACSNVGTWPVLAGEDGQHDTMFSSPIILYDYPKVTPESASGAYDGVEIDKIPSLRIMTLTEDDKREMRERARHNSQQARRATSKQPWWKRL